MDVTSLDAKFLHEEKMVPSGTRLWMPNSECELSEVGSAGAFQLW